MPHMSTYSFCNSLISFFHTHNPEIEVDYILNFNIDSFEFRFKINELHYALRIDIFEIQNCIDQYVFIDGIHGNILRAFNYIPKSFKARTFEKEEDYYAWLAGDRT